MKGRKRRRDLLLVAIIAVFILHLPHLFLQIWKVMTKGIRTPVRVIEVVLDLVICSFHIVTMTHLSSLQGVEACLPEDYVSKYNPGLERLVDGLRWDGRYVSMLLIVSGFRVFLATFRQIEKTVPALLSFMILVLILAGSVGMVLHHQYGPNTKQFISWGES